MKRKKRGNTRQFAIFFFCLLILGALYGAWSYARERIDYFKIRRINFQNNVNLSNIYLGDIIKSYLDQNIFKISEEMVKLRYENVSRLKGLKVKRSYFPPELNIKITERFAVVQAKTKDGFFLPVDEEKIILDVNSVYAPEDVPVLECAKNSNELVVGEKINDYAFDKLFNKYREIKTADVDFLAKISDFYIKDDIIYFTLLPAGTKIIIGDDEIPLKIKRLKFFIDNKGVEPKQILDLRYKDQIVARAEEE